MPTEHRKWRGPSDLPSWKPANLPTFDAVRKAPTRSASAHHIGVPHHRPAKLPPPAIDDQSSIFNYISPSTHARTAAVD